MKTIFLTFLLIVLFSTFTYAESWEWHRYCLSDLVKVEEDWCFRSLEYMGVRTGYTIYLVISPEKAPFMLVDPDGRKEDCHTLEYCELEGIRRAKERMAFQK